MKTTSKMVGTALALSVAAVIPMSASMAVASTPAPSVEQQANSQKKYLSIKWSEDEGFASTIGDSFFGNLTAVPGMAEERVFVVRNDGPTQGTMRLLFTNVSYSGSPDDKFLDDVRFSIESNGINKTYTLKELTASDPVVVGQTSVAKGGTSEVKMTISLDKDSTAGNAADGFARQAEYSLVVQMGGELPRPLPSGPTLPPSKPSNPSKPGSAGSDKPPSQPSAKPSSKPANGKGNSKSQDSLADTGAAVLLLAGIGVVLVGGGYAMYKFSRKDEVKSDD